MTNSILRSPEVLLSNLNRVGLELLGAISMLENSELSDQLTAVLRRLIIADLLSKESIIAIGGSQGAGKTTLARLMYDLTDDEWLPANEGRGECMPVLLLEDDAITEPQGYIRRLIQVSPISSNSDSKPRQYFKQEEVKVSSVEFRNATRGQGTNDLLPVLRLPRRYFTFSEQAFLLLPGYEKQHDENDAWQDLMRQALVGASASIIVTDQARLANSQQREILKDLHANQLAGTLPIVIISKTEDSFGNATLQKSLRDSAGEVFEIDSASRERFIFCTSANPEHIKDWKEQLKNALQQVTNGSGQARQRQLKHLDILLQHDLTAILSDIRTKFTIQSGLADAGGHAQVQEFLETFDRAKDRLRRDYRNELAKSLNVHADQAGEKLSKDLIDNHEGFVNKLGNLFNTVGQDRDRLLEAIESAWADTGAFSETHIDILSAITKDKLGCPAAMPLLNMQGVPRLAHTNSHLERLAYSDAQGVPVVWTNVDSGTLQNLAVVFYPERDENGMAGQTNKDMRDSIKLLPALTLEFCRVGNIFPQGLGIDSKTMTAMPDTNLTDAAQNIQRTFSQLGDIKSNVIKGFAIMLAIDGAADGKIDTIPAVLSALGLGSGEAAAASAGAGEIVTSTTTAGIGLAGVVTGMVAVGLLAYAARNEVNRQDTQTREVAMNALFNIKERHLAHYLEHFDMMMDRVRETMQERLSLRYRLDESLMRRDRVIKAMSDVASFKLDLQEQLGMQGYTMALVAPAS